MQEVPPLTVRGQATTRREGSPPTLAVWGPLLKVGEGLEERPGFWAVLLGLLRPRLGAEEGMWHWREAGLGPLWPC